jgi:hypothetical protein
VFGPVRELPDTLIFENFLRGTTRSSTFARLREGIAQLAVISDFDPAKGKRRDLIGTRASCTAQTARGHPSGPLPAAMVLLDEVTRKNASTTTGQRDGPRGIHPREMASPEDGSRLPFLCHRTD